MRQDHDMTPSVLDARQQHEPNNPGRRAEDGGYESADMADQGAKQFRAGQAGMYTAEDMADQGAQGWRDGYAWAKGEDCPASHVMGKAMTDYKLVPVEGLRYTSDGALAECPCCGSLEVGGAHDTVNCYGCGLTVTKPRPLQNAIDAWNTRTGRTHPEPAVQGEPVGYLHKRPERIPCFFDSYDEAMLSGCEVVPVYTRLQPSEQQPAPDVAGLVEQIVTAIDAEQARLIKEGYLMDSDECIEVVREWFATHQKREEGK